MIGPYKQGVAAPKHSLSLTQTLQGHLPWCAVLGPTKGGEGSVFSLIRVGWTRKKQKLVGDSLRRPSRDLPTISV